MLSRPLREVMAATVDPKLVSAYETAHAAGARVGAHGDTLRKGIATLKEHVPEAKGLASFMEGVPTESKGVRKVVDYAFTPVGQVAKDVKGLFRRKTAAEEAFVAAVKAAAFSGRMEKNPKLAPDFDLDDEEDD